MSQPQKPPQSTGKPSEESARSLPNTSASPRIQLPLTNYTLSSECPACGSPTVRHACKVRCERCGFMWDCSEL